MRVTHNTLASSLAKMVMMTSAKLSGICAWHHGNTRAKQAAAAISGTNRLAAI